MDAAKTCAITSRDSAMECLQILKTTSPTASECKDIISTLEGISGVVSAIARMIPHGDENSMIAVLDRDCKIVEMVHLTQVAVKDALGLKSKAAVSAALKNNTKCQGRRLKMWSDLGEDVKAEYLTRGSLPEPDVGKGALVYSMHPDSLQIIEIFTSISDAVQKMHIARETIHMACKSGVPYNGVLWSFTPPS